MFSRLESEVGNIEKWKEKADNFEDLVLDLRRQLVEQERQKRSIFKDYQRLLAASVVDSQDWRKNPSREISSTFVASSSVVQATIPRPKSAPLNKTPIVLISQTTGEFQKKNTLMR